MTTGPILKSLEASILIGPETGDVTEFIHACKELCSVNVQLLHSSTCSEARGVVGAVTAGASREKIIPEMYKSRG